MPTAVHYPVPLNEQPAYQYFCYPDCMPIASDVARKVISLPMDPDLSEFDQQKIVNTNQTETAMASI